MNILITGVAGFIGSHLAERLLKEGYSLRGIDSLTNYYPRKFKEDNIKNLLCSKNFQFIEQDLRYCDLSILLKDIDIIFHQSAQAGVRSSWGQNFSIYIEQNILVTQRLLEFIKNYSVKKFIYASSSSVYGDITEHLIMREDLKPQPISPYGVTKLAGEQLAYLYWKNYNIPTTALRYFTVYGPRQRPDMAFHKFIHALLQNQPITIYGDGTQQRDFTYIDDIIEANIAALQYARAGEIYNIGGGHIETLNNILNIMEEITQKKIQINYSDKQQGDVYRTNADIKKAKSELNYQPVYNLKEGLKIQIQWMKTIYSK